MNPDKNCADNPHKQQKTAGWYTTIFNGCVAADTAFCTSFGARYYDDFTETYSYNHVTDKDLIPTTIVVGTTEYKFEISTIEFIAKRVGVPVNKYEQASWIRLKSKSINYWFISDNEMGNGSLTAVALAKDISACTEYNGILQVPIKNPMLNASKEKSGTFFNNNPKKDIVMYYKDVKKSDEYTQSNSVMYYLKDENVQGLFISQGTTN